MTTSTTLHPMCRPFYVELAHAVGSITTAQYLDQITQSSDSARDYASELIKEWRSSQDEPKDEHAALEALVAQGDTVNWILLGDVTLESVSEDEALRHGI